VIYKNGAATSSRYASFFIDDFSLVQRNASLTGKIDPADARAPAPPTAPVDASKLISLGGRWTYEPAPGESVSSSTALTVTEETPTASFTKATA